MLLTCLYAFLPCDLLEADKCVSFHQVMKKNEKDYLEYISLLKL